MFFGPFLPSALILPGPHWPFLSPPALWTACAFITEVWRAHSELPSVELGVSLFPVPAVVPIQQWEGIVSASQLVPPSPLTGTDVPAKQSRALWPA